MPNDAFCSDSPVLVSGGRRSPHRLRPDFGAIRGSELADRYGVARGLGRSSMSLLSWKR